MSRAGFEIDAVKVKAGHRYDQRRRRLKRGAAMLFGGYALPPRDFSISVPPER